MTTFPCNAGRTIYDPDFSGTAQIIADSSPLIALVISGLFIRLSDLCGEVMHNESPDPGFSSP